jgi:murein L,D-transpeptidase YcbB/YkuD
LPVRFLAEFSRNALAKTPSMSSSQDRDDGRQGMRLPRRAFLRHAGALALGGAFVQRAFAENDPALDALMGETDSPGSGLNFDQGSRTIAMPKATAPMLSPSTAQMTEQAVKTYDGIVARGGWPMVPQTGELKIGVRDPGLVPLRQRLAASGDLDPHAVAADNDIYDSYVEEAVIRFQARHGLATNGVAHASTLAAMNISAAMRRDQLKINIERLKTLTTNLGPRYVVVNIPAARVEAIENGVAVQRHTAVVGKPDRPSPDINSKIVQVNFNPFWTVPVSIVHKDLIPLMQDKPDYLTDNHIRIYDAQHREVLPSQINWYSEDAVHYTFREDPGDHNSLGRIRINFPSQYGVYMHDTPLKNLFGGDFRYDSSGCCRVQNVQELVVWLLDGTKGWGPDHIVEAVKSGEQVNANLTRPVPLHWVYVTAWSASDGVVQFREYIYSRDGLGAPAISTTTKL